MPGVDMTEGQFRELFDAVSNWGRWPDDGGRGALNHLTPARIAAAAGLVETGVTVTLSQPLRTEASIAVPKPADHHMTMLTDVDIGSGSVRFAKDYVGADYHNDGHTHIDAFCHVAVRRLVLRRPGWVRSTSSRTGWSAAASCSTCRGCGASHGSSRATTCHRQISTQRSAITR